MKAIGSIHGIVGYRLSSATERAVGLFIAVGLAYFLATWLGVALRPQVALCIYCPAAGVAVGALILSGPNARMPIATSVAITTVASSIMFGRSPWEAAAFGFVNTGQALLTIGWSSVGSVGNARSRAVDAKPHLRSKRHPQPGRQKIDNTHGDEEPNRAFRSGGQPISNNAMD